MKTPLMRYREERQVFLQASRVWRNTSWPDHISVKRSRQYALRTRREWLQSMMKTEQESQS